MPSTASRLFAAALFAVVASLAVVPARSAEIATPDDTARFLAGLPPAQNSPLAALAKDPGWAQHARFFDSIFAREDASTLAKVRAFAKENLPQHHDTMLYMFSGPDFLYATSFFPSASTYVLSGLEPVGDVPQLTGLPRGAVDASLRNMEGSLASILNLSFFITKNMKTQLTTGPVYGTLPILYVFLARTGKTVHDVELRQPRQGRQFHRRRRRRQARRPRDDAKRRQGRQDRVFRRQRTKPDALLLQHRSVRRRRENFRLPGILRKTRCRRQLPQKRVLSAARRQFQPGAQLPGRSQLNRAGGRQRHSARLFRPEEVAPAAVRRYLAPLGIFPNTYQPRLADLFDHSAPLDFGIGYRWRKNESNLLLATRLPPGPGEAEFNPPLTIGSDIPPTVVEGPKPHHKPPPTPPTPRRSDGLRGFFSVFGFDDPAARPRPPK